MTVGRALMIVILMSAMSSAGLDLMLSASAQEPRKSSNADVAKHIVDATNGRADPTFLATTVVVLTFLGGSAMAGTVVYVMNKLISRHLDQSREDHRAAIDTFRDEMETERAFHSTQIHALIESDERQHKQASDIIREVCDKFTAKVEQLSAK